MSPSTTPKEDNKSKAAYVPTGKARGRPPKSPKPATGSPKPRGRPPSKSPPKPKAAYVPTGNPRGRRPGQKNKIDNRGAHLRKPDHLKVGRKVYVPTGKPRGRPKKTAEIE